MTRKKPRSTIIGVALLLLLMMLAGLLCSRASRRMAAPLEKPTSVAQPGPKAKKAALPKPVAPKIEEVPLADITQAEVSATRPEAPVPEPSVTPAPAPGEVIDVTPKEYRPPRPNPCEIRAVGVLTASSLHRKQEAIFLDVRPPAQFVNGHIPGSINMDVSKFEIELERLVKGVPNVARIMIFCASHICDDADKVCHGLYGHGYKELLFFEGGWEAWLAAGLPIEQGGKIPRGRL